MKNLLLTLLAAVAVAVTATAQTHAPFFTEAPIYVQEPCTHDDEFSLKVPIRVPAGAQVQYMWYRNGNAVGAMQTLPPAAGNGHDTIRYTASGVETTYFGDGETFHFTYRLLNSDCNEWTPGGRWVVDFSPPYPCNLVAGTITLSSPLPLDSLRAGQEYQITGTAATFNAAEVLDGTLSYQWYRNGNPIGTPSPAQRDHTVTTANAHGATEQHARRVILNGKCRGDKQLQSNTLTLTFLLDCGLDAGEVGLGNVTPEPNTALNIVNVRSAAFSYSNFPGTSNANIAYQWYLNDALIPGATGTTYHVAAADAMGVGLRYRRTATLTPAVGRCFGHRSLWSEITVNFATPGCVLATGGGVRGPDGIDPASLCRMTRAGGVGIVNPCRLLVEGGGRIAFVQ